MRSADNLTGAAVLLVLKGGAAGAALLWNIVLASALGPAGYGSFVVAFAAASVLAVLVRLGTDLPVLREAAQGEETTLFGTALRATLGGSLVVAIALVASTGPVSVLLDIPGWADLAGPAALLVPLYGVTWITGERLKGLDRPRLGITVQHALPHGLFLVGVLATPPADARAALLLFGVAWAAALVTGFLTAGGRSGVGPFRPAALRASVPLLVLAVMNVTIMWVDVFMLSAMADAEIVAFYNAALRYSGVVVFALVATSSLLSPGFAREAAGAGSSGSASLRRALALGALLALVIALPIWLLRLPLLGLFGPEFTVAALPLTLLLLGQTAHAVLGIGGYILVMRSGDREMGWIAFIAGVTNVILNAILIPRHGMAGAAVATAASLLLMDALALAVLLKTRPRPVSA